MVFKTTGSDRYTMFPIKHDKLWDFYKRHEASFWTVEEIRLSDDLLDWSRKLNDNERYFIKNVLAFFASSDGIINENLILNFYKEIQLPEARAFYTVQMMMESIHSEQYSVLIDTYIADPKEKKELFQAIETIPSIKKKADWALKWLENGGYIGNDLPESFIDEYKKLASTSASPNPALDFLIKQPYSLEQRLLAFICVEGIFFSGSFCAIYWLKNKGLMPGLGTANQFISRDENLHAEFAIELYKMTENKLDESVVHDIFKEAVEIEKEFITDSLPVSLLGMNCALMSEYIEYVADRWLVLLGHKKIYNAKCPFTFMELLNVNTKENFFEHDVSEYNKSDGNTELIFDEDF